MKTEDLYTGPCVVVVVVVVVLLWVVQWVVGMRRAVPQHFLSIPRVRTASAAASFPSPHFLLLSGLGPVNTGRPGQCRREEACRRPSW